VQNKRLGTFALAGFIIGPILGSGIILLPPLLYNSIGSYSLFVFALMLCLGFIFALIFGRLANLYKGEAGVSLATKEALGKKYQLLTSFYLICAVLFGPVAVLLIAAKFIQDLFPSYSLIELSILIYSITYALLLLRIDFLGKLMLFVSSFISILFLVSSIYILFTSSNFEFNFPLISVQNIGHSFLIVFWAIVGWEVIGNYSKHVKDDKSLSHAVMLSAIIVSLVYLLVILAICFGEFDLKETEEFSLLWLIEPLFYEYSSLLLSSTSLILCIGTLILFVGGVARLICSLKVFVYSSVQTKTGIPLGALNLLTLFYACTLFLVYLNYLTLNLLVAFADGFFIANALIGLFTAMVLFEKGFLKYMSVLLLLVFTGILFFSNAFILLIIISLFVWVYFKK